MTPARSDRPRVALVTGAARGIGAAVTERLATDGWQVVAVDLCSDLPWISYPLGTEKQLHALADRWPGNVRPFVADVRDRSALAEVVDTATRAYGGLDAAVAAAGVINGGRPLWETSEADWNILFDVNVHGVANLARAALPALLTQPPPRTGRFVALTSAGAHHGLRHLAGYGATKSAVTGLIRGLATDLRGTGVTATAVSPGSTRTAMLDASATLYDLPNPEAFADHQLVDRLLEPPEVAAVVCWLCEAPSGAVTGTVIHADGGFTA